MSQNGSEQERVAAAPVAIIGMGCLFPGANGTGRFWANVRDGVDSIREVPETHWNPADYFDPDPKAPDRTYARRGGFLDPVDFPALEFGIAPNNIEATDTTQLLGLFVARQALEDAGYGAGRAFDRDRVSVILGVTGTLELVIPLGARLGHPIWRRALKSAGVPDDTAETVVRHIADSYVGWQENSFPGLLGNVAAGRIANRLDLGGTNCVIDAACASSLGAINLGLLELATGRADMVLTGGLDTFNDIFMYMCFSKTPALSPTGDARPFDASADGTILGEGLGVVVLKRLEDARRDGDRVYAVIRSIGSSSDGKGSAVYAPKAAGQAKALRRAYELAGITPDTIELVEAHGTGTKVGDATELAALSEVFREARAEGSWCTLGSVKSQIGHTKAAAGAAGLMKAALALHHKVLPPTAKVERPADDLAPGVSPFVVNRDASPWLPRPGHPRRAAVSAFGFGGSNFHCVLEEADPALSGIDWDGDVQLAAFSGASLQVLHAALEAWPASAEWDVVCAEAARTRERFQVVDEYRLVLVLERGADVARRLRDARAWIDAVGAKPFAVSADGIAYGRGARQGALAVLFPGQGSQYVGMFRALACRFPALAENLAEANAAGDAPVRLSDLIYPPTAYDDAAREAQDAALRATESAQPAIGAVSLGAWRVLEHFGVQADVLAGHSFGELTALCVAGRIAPAAFHRLARLRGRLMAEREGDRGAMLAVLAPAERVERLRAEHQLDLVIANKNAPQQTVLSGPVAEIERAAQLCGAQGLTARRLPVAAAFHSRFVAMATAPFREALGAVAFDPARVPVFANTTAAPYPHDPDEARTLLAEQLARPVEFVAEIEAMYQSGARTFLEVGPDGRLTALVSAILEGRDHVALAVDASRGRRGPLADLARCLAALAAAGHPLDLARWQEGFSAQTDASRSKPSLTVKVSGANASPRRSPAPLPQSVSRPENSTASRRNGKPPEPVMTHQNGSSRHASSTNGTPAPTAAPPAAAVPRINPVPLGNADPSLLAQALRTVQENLLALQQVSTQTAEVHRLFLEGQDRAQLGFQALLEQQQRLTGAALGLASEAGAMAAPVLRAPVAPRPAIAPAPAPAAPRSFVAPPAPVPAPAAPLVHTPSAPEPPAAAPSVTAGPTASSNVARVLIEVVSEKTGYPSEMLEPSMQLDADLGIDSIKRVEILSALQERLPHAPVIKPEQLGSIRSLADIIDFLAAGDSVAAVPAPAPAGSASAVQAVLIEVVSEKTGYPAEMLEPGMQLDADLGIDSIKRVEILSALQERLPHAPVIKPEQLGSIRSLADIVEFLAGSEAPATAAPSPPAPSVTPATRNGAAAPSMPTAAALVRLVPSAVPLPRAEDRPPIRLRGGAHLWVVDDGSELTGALAQELERRGSRVQVVQPHEASTVPVPPQLDGLVLLATNADDPHVKASFTILRRASSALRAAGKSTGALLVSVSQLGGTFGLSGLSPDREPAAGALAGIVKTSALEWPEVSGKAIDLDETLDDPTEAVAAEVFAQGPVEVGLSAGGTATVQLLNVPMSPGVRGPLFDREDVVVITGGARGVTAEVALSLAEAFQPTIVLLGRSPAPEPEPGWLAGLAGETEIKKALAARANGHATPQAVAEHYRSVASNREIAGNLQRIAATGATVVYRSVDVRDGAALGRCLEAIRTEIGPIRGVVHGAGVLADRRIEDQSDEQFTLVYDTKVAGLNALLEQLEAADLKALVLFSSSTARFGRTGQVAYAAANEVLNKTAQREASRRPSCRVLAVNWGPWDGGMVTSALKPLFEAEGVGLIPLRAGAEYLVDELAGPGPERPVEVVVLGPGSRVPTPVASAASPALTPVFERVVDVDSVPILDSHVIDGRPVLPMALMFEWLAQGAAQRNPGLVFAGFGELRLLKGVVLRGGQSETLRVLAGKAVRKGSQFAVPVALVGTLGAAEVSHARGEVLLAERYVPEQATLDRLDLPPFSMSVTEAYRDALFHGPMLQGIEQIDGCGELGITARVATSPAPSEWLKSPLRQTWLSDPLAIDCAFQLMICWCTERLGAPSLPTRVTGYRQYRREFPRDGVRIAANVIQTTTHKAVAEIEFLDADGTLVARIDNYECVVDASLNDAFRRNQAVPAGPR